MVSNGFPNVTTSGQQYNTGEKPSGILYTYLNLHAGTPKTTILFICLGVPDYSVVVIWSFMVLEKLNKLVCSYSLLLLISVSLHGDSGLSFVQVSL